MHFDDETGQLSATQTVTGIENPSYLTVAPDGRSLHANWEVLNWPEGLVSSYSIDPKDGSLTYRGVQGARGSVTSHCTMDSGSRCCLVTNYLNGTVALFPVRPDGSLAEPTSVVQQAGSGSDPERQKGPHAHCFAVSPDDRFAFAADLGADRVFGYRVEYDTGELIPHSEVAFPAGSGPRHFVFHPNGQVGFVIYELESRIGLLAYDADAGSLRFIEDYSTLPADFTGHSHCADIHVHPSGKWVYGSNRGHDSIAIFEVGAEGRLTPCGHRSTEGATPRNFALSPDGRHVLAANQDSDTVVVMTVDAESGLPAETLHTASVPTPVCLKFGAPVAKNSSEAH